MYNEFANFDRQTDRQTDRIVGLDLFRIVAVLVIFLFHSNIHLECSYGILTSFVQMGAIYMSAFFLLSGFSLYLSYQHKNLYKIKENKSYILKRIIGIVPLYYVVSVLYVIFLGKETTFQNILLAPIEMMGLQSMFSLFSVSHNSGTWFISCILICYFVYPLLQEISKQIRLKSKIIILGLIVFVLVWSPFVVIHFGLVSIYYNPFFRLIEFFAGVLLSSVMPHIRNSKISRIVFSWWVLTLEFMFMFIAVTVAVKKRLYVGNYMLYSGFAFSLFMMQIITISGVKMPRFLNNSKLLRYLISLSYAFWLSQFFAFDTTMFIISIIRYNNNFVRIILSFIICMIYAILLHELIEKPIVKALRRKILNK